VTAGTAARPRGGTGLAGRGRSRASVRLCVCACVLSSCAYYNGMYNANRWTAQAERSERAGRTGEARERWARAAMHAESVLSRHPRSRWADDAMLARGRALLHLDQPAAAVAQLERAARATDDPHRRDEAHLLLGRANLALRRLPQAESALAFAVLARRDGVRDEAHWRLGRTYLALGRPDDALRELVATRHSGAAVDRLRAALQLRDTALARTAADALLAAPFDERAWTPVLDSLAAAGLRDAAGRVVEGVLSRDDVSSGAKARLLVDDGARWAAAGHATEAGARYERALAVAPDSMEARTAAVRLMAIRAAAARDAEDLADLPELLSRIAARGGEPAREAQDLLALLERLDSLSRADSTPDVAWFLRAELARDSLRAAPLAARLFAEMETRHPGSPWTPKALLAAIVAGHPDADSLEALLRDRHAASPYVTAVFGPPPGDPVAFAALEDSLRVTLARARPAAPAGREPRPGDDLDPRNRPAQPPSPLSPPPAPRPGPTTRPRIDP